MPPEASETARPPIQRPRRAISAGVMLSSRSRSAPASSASSISARLRHSTSTGMPGRAPLQRQPRCRPHPARQRDVVVLDQDRVVQAHAVVAATPGRHRLLFERPQPGRGLARVEHLHAGPVQLAHGERGRRGDARQVLEEVERHPLPGEQRARFALELGDRRRRLVEPVALVAQRRAMPRPDPAGGRRPPRRPGRRPRPGCLLVDAGPGAAAGLDQGLGREVARNRRPPRARARSGLGLREWDPRAIVIWAEALSYASSGEAPRGLVILSHVRGSPRRL